MTIPKTICVYCGSSVGSKNIYRSVAQQLGTAMARAGIRLVYGGAHVGLMGALADAILAAGGQAIGVIPRNLADREVAHTGLTQLHVVDTMHQRKHCMADLADAFIALPGGYGTLDELCEILGWAQLGLHSKPIVVLNVSGYYDPLLAMLDHAVEEGFLQPLNRQDAMEAATVEEAMQAIQSVWSAPAAR